MKLFALLITVFSITSASAAELSCTDSQTFAYGRAQVVDDGSGAVTVAFSSSMIVVFVDELVSVPTFSPERVTLTFAARDCEGLGSCSGEGVAMQFLAEDGSVASVLLSRASVTVGPNGLQVQGASEKGVAAARIPLNRCVTTP